MTIRFEASNWAVILGGSSGFGYAAAARLARAGMSVAVIHRDRRGAMPAISERFERIRALGVELLTFNLDALAPEAQALVVTELKERLSSHGRVRLLLHSIAYGNLKPLVAQPGSDDLVLEDEDFARTVYSMGTSLATWTRLLFERQLFADDARVLGITSAGGQLCWPGYAAVSAAKAALESVSRAIALEYAKRGIRSNVIQAGVADTPALRLIPGSDAMREDALRKNPCGRLTTPEDVANVICLLCTDEARWINGALLRVDGGEFVVG